MASPIVTVAQGKLKGSVGRNINDEEILKFLAIPYAKPPIGELRFKAPQPPEPWDGIRNATEDGSPCFSTEEGTGKYLGSEDCLILNVYTKKLLESSNNLKPVMVFFHGGGFIIGSSKSTQYGPEILLTKDIVLVTLNYRLGILGFLSIDDLSLEVPGNAGLKDQNLALEWIQENIRNFNGDPNNVTLFGSSAGGASIHLHVLFNSPRKLFHKVILQSGCSFNSWAWGYTDVKDIAKKLGHEPENDENALIILIETPVEQLCSVHEKYNVHRLWGGCRRPFGPVIEKPNPTAFLTEDPVQIILSGKYRHVPMIIGYASREGMIADFYETIGLVKEEIPDIRKSIPWQIQIKTETDKNIVVSEIEKLYFKDPSDKDDTYVYLSDTMFIFGIIETVRLHLKTAKEPIYLYRMSADTSLNYFKPLVPTLQNFAGACHSDDIGYLFKHKPKLNIVEGSIEETLINAFVTFWTDFSKYGNPTPNQNLGVIWRPVKSENQMYFLDFNSEISLQQDPEPLRMRFWKRLLEIYPFVTNLK